MLTIYNIMIIHKGDTFKKIALSLILLLHIPISQVDTDWMEYLSKW